MADRRPEAYITGIGVVSPERVGLILGSGIGGVTSMETTQATIDSKGPSRVNPFAVTKIMPNSAAAHVSIQLGVQGPSITGALACTCGTDMMGLGYDLIRRGDADVVLCGASEAGLAPVIVAGFIAMRAMSRRNDDPEGACRPYDVDHSGFLIGEASASCGPCSSPSPTPDSEGSRSAT